MRADFWGDCADYRRLADRMEASQRLISAMTTPELRGAIEQQAKKVGLNSEADLSNDILDDVKDEPGAMPLLQHALRELWGRRHGRWLLHDEYNAIGGGQIILVDGQEQPISGIKGAIAHSADQVYRSLSPANREHMRNIFVRLTRLGEAHDGQPRRDTRQRVGLEELLPPEDQPEARRQARELIRRLADERLIITSRHTPSGQDEAESAQEATIGSGQDEVEVAHEAVIRYWPRLQTWLNADEEDLRLRDSIRQAALDWQRALDEGGDADSYLVHHGDRLSAAERLTANCRIWLSQLDLAYIQACVDRREQERREMEERERREREALKKAAEAEAKRAQQAEEAAEKLQEQVEAANAARKRAEQQTRFARANQLAAQFHTVDDPTASLNLMLGREAVFATLFEDGYPALQADSALREAVTKAQQLPWRMTFPWRQGHTGAVDAVAFSPDGHNIVSGGTDETVRLWDVAGQKEIGRPGGHAGGVFSVAFSPDGDTIVSGGQDGAVRLWPTIHSLLRLSDRLIQRDPPIFMDDERARFGLDGINATHEH